MWIESFEPLDVLGSWHGVAEAVATLPREKGQTGFARGGACLRVRGIEVFHSIKTMLRKLHKAVAER